MPIWAKYFFKETIKAILLFLLIFYGLYVLIDFSSHSASAHYHHSKFNWFEFSKYYLCSFIDQLEILLPFGILIGTIKTLTNLNVRNELVALLAGGISLKRLLLPFLVIGMFGVGFLYLNTQFFVPFSLKCLKKIDDKHALEKNRARKDLAVNSLLLEDGTTLLYGSYDTALQRFIDTYWLISIDEIYKIQALEPYTHPPQGSFVDHLKRNKQDALVVVESYPVKEFPNLKFNEERLAETLTPPENLSLTSLYQRLPTNSISEKDAQIEAAFYRKMLMPWLCLFAVLIPAPSAVRYSRNLPVFFIYALSLFALVAIYLVLNSMTVLAERQVLKAFEALGIPFIIIFSILLYRYRS